jgi:hypothetical protein
MTQHSTPNLISTDLDIYYIKPKTLIGQKLIKSFSFATAYIRHLGIG